MTAKKTALIIGGSGGIGSAIVQRLLADSFVVCATYVHNGERLASLRRVSKDKPVSFYCIDLLNENAAESAIEQLIIEHSTIDVVVFAPTLPTPHTPLLTSSWPDFAAHLNVQLRGMWQIVQGLKPQFTKGHPIKFIVILTEYCIGKPPGGLSPYLSAKYALMGFAKMMAVELTRYGCTTNMILPGMVATDLIKTVPPKLVEMAAAQNPLKRITSPEDVAGVVSFLASDWSGYLNGAQVPVNGGSIMV